MAPFFIFYSIFTILYSFTSSCEYIDYFKKIVNKLAVSVWFAIINHAT